MQEHLWDQMLIATLASTLLKGLLALLVAVVLDFVLRRAAAANRHLLWSLVLSSLLALPWLASVVPVWSVPVPQRWSLTIKESSGAGTTEGSDPQSSRRLQDESDARTAAAEALREPLNTAALEQAQVRGGADWRIAVLGVWFLGALAVLSMLALGRYHFTRICGRARSVSRLEVLNLARRLAAESGLGAVPRLLEADTAMPVTGGILRPTILLPRGASSWSSSSLEIVLRHEFTHVRRRDHLPQLAAALACALNWPNPLIWYAARRLRIECEHACDDEVLHSGIPASEYAAELLGLARVVADKRRLASAWLSFAKPSQLPARIRALFDDRRRRAVASRAMIARALFLTVIPLVLLVGARPVDPSAAPPSVGTQGAASAPSTSSGPRVGLAHPTSVSECWRDGVRDRSRNWNEELGILTLTWSSPACFSQISLSGAIEFGWGRYGIERMTPDGLLRIVERDRGTVRALEARAGSEGSPTYEFRLDGQLHEPTGESLAWLQQRLDRLRQEIPRTTAVPALRDFIDEMAPPRHLDGQLAKVEGLVQRSPHDGAEEMHPTEVYASYDRQNLYLPRVKVDFPADESECWRESVRDRSMNRNEERGTWTVTWSSRRCLAEIRLRSTIALDPDRTGIARVSSTGLLLIEESDMDTTRRLEVRAGPDGEPEYALWINGRHRDLTSDARTWLRDRLEMLDRYTSGLK